MRSIAILVLVSAFGAGAACAATIPVAKMTTKFGSDSGDKVVELRREDDSDAGNFGVRIWHMSPTDGGLDKAAKVGMAYTHNLNQQWSAELGVARASLIDRDDRDLGYDSTEFSITAICEPRTFGIVTPYLGAGVGYYLSDLSGVDALLDRTIVSATGVSRAGAAARGIAISQDIAIENAAGMQFVSGFRVKPSKDVQVNFDVRSIFAKAKVNGGVNIRDIGTGQSLTIPIASGLTEKMNIGHLAIGAGASYRF